MASQDSKNSGAENNDTNLNYGDFDMVLKQETTKSPDQPDLAVFAVSLARSVVDAAFAGFASFR